MERVARFLDRQRFNVLFPSHEVLLNVLFPSHDMLTEAVVTTAVSSNDVRSDGRC